ncbi:hypothetical protein [Rhizobium sp. R693]|nr:hypothetical protein [Rhizobium sp. R693]
MPLRKDLSGTLSIIETTIQETFPTFLQDGPAAPAFGLRTG